MRNVDIRGVRDLEDDFRCNKRRKSGFYFVMEGLQVKKNIVQQNKFMKECMFGRIYI